MANNSISSDAVSMVLPEKFMSHLRAGSDPKVFEVYQSLFSFSASPSRTSWSKSKAKLKKAALNNEFFTEDEKKEMRLMGQEPHVINKLVIGIQGASAVATSNRPDIKVFPLRESDPYLAELVKSGLEHVWLKNHGSDVIYDMVEEKNISGIGCIEIYKDENKGPFGAVVFEEGDASDWYWDENSRKRDRSDTHLIKAKLRSFEYIKDNYDLKDEDIVSVDDGFDAGEGVKPDVIEDTKTAGDNYKFGEQSHIPKGARKKSRRVWEIAAHMLKTEKEHWAVVFVENEEVPYIIRLVDVKSKKEALEAIDKIVEEGLDLEGNGGSEMTFSVTSAKYWLRRMNNRYTRIIVGDKLIPQPIPEFGPDDHDNTADELKNIYGVDSDGDPVLPVVFYYGQRLEKAYHNGPTFYAFDPNKSLCKREAQYTLALSKNLSAPIAREESGVYWRDPEYPDRPGNEIIIGKASRMPTRLNPGVIDFGAVTNRIIEDKANIDDAYSLPEVMRGKIPKGIERMSGRLGLALQETGTIMQSPSIRGLESTMEYLGKALLAVMLQCWPPIKWESLVTEDRINEFRPANESQVPEIDKTDELKAEERADREAKWGNAVAKISSGGMSVVDFNLAITAGSSLPTNRLLKEETAREDFKIGLRDRRAALEYSGDPHAKEIADRMDRREMEMAQAGIKPRRG